MSLGELDEFEHMQPWLVETLPARKLFLGPLHGLIAQVNMGYSRVGERAS